MVERAPLPRLWQAPLLRLLPGLAAPNDQADPPRGPYPVWLNSGPLVQHANVHPFVPGAPERQLTPSKEPSLLITELNNVRHANA